LKGVQQDRSAVANPFGRIVSPKPAQYGNELGHEIGR
jgi:hypothetical protein